ncbi:MAG: hypothetical protein EOP11_22530 [Proteobacteria bacterium]|nr:MAG: hypothetical protein EOP11_22530 [Pseudomonadota bacterium]
MKHPNAAALEAIYKPFIAGDAAGVLALCEPNVTFQIMGKSPLAGKYDAKDLSKLLTNLREFSGGSYRLETHDVMASDQHAVALCSEFVTKAGKPEQMRMAHVWRFQNGKPVAWYSYPRDLYQFDAIWG